MTRHILPLVDASDGRCVGCAALCCRQLTLPTSPPTSGASIADMRWRLHFDTVHVYMVRGAWFMVVESMCRYLDLATSLCTIYDERPSQCRDYNPPFCERYIDPAELRLHTPEDLDAYLESIGDPDPDAADP